MCSAASGTISAVSPELPSSTPSWVAIAAITAPGKRSGPTQGAHQGLVLLHLLADPAHPHPARVVADHRRQRLHAVAELLPLALLAQLGQARDRVAVRRLGGVVEQLEQPPLDGLAHHVLPAARLLVDQLPVEADDVGEQALGEPVLAHHAHREAVALVGQLEVAVALDRQQTVALHPGDGLAHGRAALVQPLRNPSAQGDDALFVELVDGAEVHLGGVDQVAHRAIVAHGPIRDAGCGG